VIGGALQQLSLGAPLVVAGLVKAGYDLALWRWARHLPPASSAALPGLGTEPDLPGGYSSR